MFGFPYMSNQNIEVDELHVMHLGTSMYMFGSILYTLVFNILTDNPAENMALVWKELGIASQELGSACTYTNLTIASFCDADRPHAAYPKLKGKGAEVKDLADPLLKVWAKLEDNIVLQMLQHQCAIQQALTINSLANLLTEADSQDLCVHIDGVLMAYTVLANTADREGYLRWNITPKFHMLWHLGERSKNLNPRRGNTMMDEGFVGGGKDSAIVCERDRVT